MLLKVTGMKPAMGIVSNKKYSICKRSDHLPKDCPKKIARTGEMSKPGVNFPKRFSYQRWNVVANCPANALAVTNEMEQKEMRSCKHKHILEILLDTRCTRNLVHE